MNSHLTPEMVATIYQHTVLAVSILLAGGGIGFSIGSGIVCGDTIECMVRQPDTRPTLMLDTFIFTGLVGNFPFIILAFGAWFLFANPFIDTLKSTLQMESASMVAPSVSPAPTSPKLTLPPLRSNCAAIAKAQPLATVVIKAKPPVEAMAPTAKPVAEMAVPAKPPVEAMAPTAKPVAEMAVPAKPPVEIVAPAKPSTNVTH